MRIFSWLLGLALLATACSGDGASLGSRSDAGTAAFFQNSLGLTRLDLEESASSRATLGPPGGVLAATAADGTVYTLTVPPGALRESVEMVMIPLRQISGVGRVFGVHFAPEGLQLLAPAALTVQPPPGTQLLGLGALEYVGNAEAPQRYGRVVGAGTLTLQVFHFSGYAAADDDLIPLSSPARDGALSGILDVQVQTFGSGAPPGPEALEEAAQAIAGHIRQWFAALGPQLSSSPTTVLTRTDFARLLNEYLHWTLHAQGRVVGAELSARVAELLAPDLAAAQDVAAEALRRRIAADNQLAVSENDLAFVEDVLHWYAYAQEAELDTPERLLDLTTILRDLPVAVVIEDEQFASSLGAGESAPLSFRAGYQIGTHPVKFDRSMLAEVLVENGTVVGPSIGELAPAATFFSGVRRESASQDLVITMEAEFDDAYLNRVSGRSYITLDGSAPPGRIAELAGTWTGTGTYTPPGDITRGFTLVLILGGTTSGSELTGTFQLTGRDLLQLRGEVYNPANFGAAVTVSGIRVGGLEGHLEPNGTLVGEWSNFDAGGTVFRFSGTKSP